MLYHFQHLSNRMAENIKKGLYILPNIVQMSIPNPSLNFKIRYSIDKDNSCCGLCDISGSPARH